MILKMKRRLILFFLVLCLPCIVTAQYRVKISDASSLVRVGMDPHPADGNDTTLAYTLRNALHTRDLDSIAFVSQVYKAKVDDDLMREKAWGSLYYITDRLVREAQGQNVSGDALADDLYEYFTGNDCEKLLQYLTLKYELDNYRPRSIQEFISQRTFFDDLLMFNDPGRSSWDKTDEIMGLLPVNKGDKVVDVGCGFGYNSIRLRELVGEEGVVYATDTEESYVKHFSDVLIRNGIENIKPVVASSDDISVEDTVDMIMMSSLYHIIYTWSREDERTAFLQSVKKRLSQDGYFVVVDNNNLHGREMNNCHVNPRLVEAQLGYWGFEPVLFKELSEQRYILVMKRNDSYIPVSDIQENESPVLEIKDARSIIHIGSLDSYDITDRGIDAARYVYDFMGGGDPALGEIAIKKYDEIIPSENFGGEYTAIQWLCEVKLADEKTRSEMLADPMSKSFFQRMTDDNAKVLRYYLLHKYKLGTEEERMLSDSLLEKSGEVGRTHRSYLEDYILALNPKRPQWENTGKIIEHVALSPGEVVADIGCGSGFFTYRFSQLIGKDGKVYALEIKDEHINTLQEFISANGIQNIKVLKGHEDYVELPEKVDKMFMCSLYHIMYGVISDSDRDAYLKSLVKNLKKNGELIIVDNGPVDDTALPYHGPYISRELIEYQLSFYGFELEEYVQIIPQRYLLRFKLVK